MDLDAISDFITRFGFPIFVSVYLMWKDSKRDKADAERDARDEKWLDLMHGLVESRNDSLDKLDTVIEKIAEMKDEMQRMEDRLEAPPERRRLPPQEEKP